MKKWVAFILLGVLLFNWGGYHLLYEVLTNWSEQQFQLTIDRHQIDEKEGLHIKLPVSLPYGTSSEAYERVEGSIELEGVTYSYVKRRFYQDTLELVCLPNIQTTQIKNARDAFASLANDFDIYKVNSTNKAPAPKPVKLNLSDFTDDHHFFSWQFRDGNSAGLLGSQAVGIIPTGWHQRIEHPPQSVAC